MKIPRKIFGELIECILTVNNMTKATKYYSKTEVVRATRRTYNGKIWKIGNVEILLTIGKPNFRERKFIKLCEKTSEPFPIKKVQFEYE